MNQTQFGDLLGVGQGEIAKLESGSNNATLETVQRIADKTGKTFSYFFEPVPGVDYSEIPEGAKSPKVRS